MKNMKLTLLALLSFVPIIFAAEPPVEELTLAALGKRIVQLEEENKKLSEKVPQLVGAAMGQHLLDTFAQKSALDEYARKEGLADYAQKSALDGLATKEGLAGYAQVTTEKDGVVVREKELERHLRTLFDMEEAEDDDGGASAKVSFVAELALHLNGKLSKKIGRATTIKAKPSIRKKKGDK